MTERLCINCRFCSIPSARDPGVTHLCLRPIGAVHSRVTGPAVRCLYVTCRSERAGRRSLLGRLKCGVEGLFFEEGLRERDRLCRPPRPGSMR